MITTPEGDAERALMRRFYVICIDHDYNIDVKIFHDRTKLCHHVVSISRSFSQATGEPFFFREEGINKVVFYDIFSGEEFYGAIVMEPFESLEFNYWLTVSREQKDLRYSYAFTHAQACDIATIWSDEGEEDITPALLEEIQAKIDEERAGDVIEVYTSRDKKTHAFY